MREHGSSSLDARDGPQQVLKGEAMESVAAYAGEPPLFCERETLGDLRESTVERRIEACDVGDVGEPLPSGSDECETGCLVQRCQHDEGVEFGEERLVDDGRGVACGASVHDAVTDGRGSAVACVREAAQDVIEFEVTVAALDLDGLARRDGVALEERHFEARRPGVQGQHEGRARHGLDQVQSRTSGMSSKCSTM